MFQTGTNFCRTAVRAHAGLQGHNSPEDRDLPRGIAHSPTPITVTLPASECNEALYFAFQFRSGIFAVPLGGRRPSFEREEKE
jgi:hypothetical protein